MHRFTNGSSIIRFRIAAFLFLLRSLLPIAGVPMLLVALLMDEHAWFWVAFGLLVAFPLVAAIQWLVAARVRCPLCLVPPLVSRGCARNRRARPLFGSYRLRTSLSALVLGHFRCQYCGEPTEMRARERGGNPGL